MISNEGKGIKKMLNSSILLAVPQKELLLFLCIMTPHDDYTERQLKNLGKRLKALRKAKGYSNYEQFAFTHEINRSQYGRYENGEDLRFSSLLKVLAALDVSLAEFFGEGFDAGEKKK
ncbi:MAG: helix-turn-helix domain-containing protein [Saprospiraceae bacterium]